MKRLLGIVAAIAVIALCAAGGLTIGRFGVGLARVAGTSMNETLASGDIVLVVRAYNTPAFGDVVECAFPNREGSYIKRVIGLPGDRIAFRDGELIRNGARVSEPYVSSPTEDGDYAPGEDEYLLLGDNRAASYDSRMADMGMVGMDGILGRVRFIVWPLSRFGRVY